MDMYDSLFSSDISLNEQIANYVFHILVEDGPVVVIMDTDGNFWASDSEEFAKLNIEQSFLAEICRKIDDGHEPVLTQINECSIVSTQLATEKTNFGYVFIMICPSSPESSLAKIYLIEILLKQMNLIAKLVEENHILCELQSKNHTNYDIHHPILN